jgi:hypothetical protein
LNIVHGLLHEVQAQPPYFHFFGCGYRVMRSNAIRVEGAPGVGQDYDELAMGFGVNIDSDHAVVDSGIGVLDDIRASLIHGEFDPIELGLIETHSGRQPNHE